MEPQPDEQQQQQAASAPPEPVREPLPLRQQLHEPPAAAYQPLPGTAPGGLGGTSTLRKLGNKLAGLARRPNGVSSSGYSGGEDPSGPLSPSSTNSTPAAAGPYGSMPNLHAAHQAQVVGRHSGSSSGTGQQPRSGRGVNSSSGSGSGGIGASGGHAFTLQSVPSAPAASHIPSTGGVAGSNSGSGSEPYAPRYLGGGGSAQHQHQQQQQQAGAADAHHMQALLARGRSLKAKPAVAAVPPAGYLWVWLGRLRRWRKRWAVASTPGVLLLYKSDRLVGPVWSLSLAGTAVAADLVHARQLQLLLPGSVLHLRAATSAACEAWRAALEQSAATLARSRELVTAHLSRTPSSTLPTAATSATGARDTLLGTPLNSASGTFAFPAAAAAASAAAGGAGGGPGAVVRGRSPLMSPLPAVASVGGWGELDPEQRKVIKARLGERLVDATAAQAHFEAQWQLSQQQLLQLACGMQLGAPAQPSDRLPATSSLGATSNAAAGAVSGPQAPLGRISTPSAGVGGSVSGGLAPAAATPAGDLSGAYQQLLRSYREALTREVMANVQLEEELRLVRQRLARALKPPARPAGPSSSAPGVPSTPFLTPRTDAAGATAAAAGGGGMEYPDSDSSSAMSDYCSAAGEVPWEEEEQEEEGGAPALTAAQAAAAALAAGVPGASRAAAAGAAGGRPGVGLMASEPSDDEMLRALDVVQKADYVVRTEAVPEQLVVLLDNDAQPPTADNSAAEEDDEEDDVTSDEPCSPLAASASSPAAAAAAAASAADAGSLVTVGSGGSSSRALVVVPGLPVLPGGRLRARLPAPKPLGRGFSIWKMLRDAIGGDLTRITMPASINEPLSFIQRLAEMMEYRPLLEAALGAPSPGERLLWITGWALAPFAGQFFRESKPFNPLLGETYAWAAPDARHRMLIEQVSHHPPISAYVAEGPRYTVTGELETKTKFWGKSIGLILAGHERLVMEVPPSRSSTSSSGGGGGFGVPPSPADGGAGAGQREVYEWNRFHLSVNDVILGRFWVDGSGDMRVTNVTTGHTALLQLRPCRGNLAARGHVSGTITDPSGTVLYTLEGNVTDTVWATPTAAAAAEAAAARHLHVSPHHTGAAAAAAAASSSGSSVTAMDTSDSVSSSAGAVAGGADAAAAAAVTSGSGRQVLNEEGVLLPDTAAVLAAGVPFVLTRRSQPPEDWAQQYCMSRFAIAMNDPDPRLLAAVAPTDSRARPDQRALEVGEVDTATSDKLRLEDKQRKARAARKQRGESYHPRWFSRTPGSPAASLITLAHSANPPAPPAWTYGGDYWRAAAAGEWDGCPDIY